MNVGDAHDLDPRERAELMGMAESFFTSEIEPLHRNSGVPEDAIAYLKREYCKAAIVNPAAMREIRAYLDLADLATGSDVGGDDE